MNEERRRSGARQRGGNLARNVPGFADATDHGASAASENELYGMHEALVETSRKAGNGTRLDVDRATGALQRGGEHRALQCPAHLDDPSIPERASRPSWTTRLHTRSIEKRVLSWAE